MIQRRSVKDMDASRRVIARDGAASTTLPHRAEDDRGWLVRTEDGAWHDVGSLHDIPRRGARVIATARGDIAVFRTGEDRIFALYDSCPHKAGRLSQGIVHGDFVTCPLHNWVISLEDGQAREPDEGCARRVPLRLQGMRILLALNA